MIWNSEAYKTVFNKVNDAILVYPLQKEGFANFIAVNGTAIQIYGYTEEEFLTLSPENITKKEDVRIYGTKGFRQELYEGRHKIFETTHYTKDGREIQVEISSNVVRIEGRQVIVALVRDISARKYMEDNLQNQNRKYLKLNEELSKALSALENLNSELKKAKLKAEESDRLKTAFLGNISHEIRTPMNGIIGFVDILKLSEGLNPRQTKYLSIIEKSSIRLLKIINNIVEIAKIESDNFSVKQEIIDLDMLFSELYQENYSYAERRGIDLKFKNEINQREPYIQSDKRALKKILENLIDNAIKYTFEGDVTYGCQIHNNYIEFYVDDTGEGIRRKDLNIIFDQFSQGDPVFSTINNGAGLGLSIAKAHVSTLGGTIWVESELGEGSSFHFTIPLEPVDKVKIRSGQKNLTIHKKEKK